MEFVTDLHVHSKYSRAVSQDMVLSIMDKWAKKKGINILATADWTHPLWLREIRAQLTETSEGLFQVKSGIDSTSKESPSIRSGQAGHLRGEVQAESKETLFILSTEISSIYSQGGKVRRIHNLVLSPSFETAQKINQELLKRGCNLSSDGRPIIGISSRNLLELILAIDKRAMLIPCHAWTPWFSLYGSMSGFDSIEECFGDYSKYIYAIETGLSSDPEMNRRIKELENRSIISSSDSHSPAKMGREATVFELPEASYGNIYKAIRLLGNWAIGSAEENPNDLTTQKPSNLPRITYTIEFYPEEGKYHYTGHRNCKVVQSPEETKEKGVICPVCKRPLTVGVMHRVEQLSDQRSTINNQQSTIDENGVKWIQDPTEKHPPFVKLVPLNEIIAEAFSSQVASIKVKALFDEMCEKFGSEVKILLRTKLEEIEKFAGPKIAEGIAKVRSGDIVVEPGFDGEYGKVRIWGSQSSNDQKIEQKKKEEEQLGLF